MKKIILFLFSFFVFLFIAVPSFAMDANYDGKNTIVLTTDPGDFPCPATAQDFSVSTYQNGINYNNEGYTPAFNQYYVDLGEPVNNWSVGDQITLQAFCFNNGSTIPSNAQFFPVFISQQSLSFTYGTAQDYDVPTPPKPSTISVSQNPVLINKETTAAASFADPIGGSSDTATWQWGDGNTSDGTVVESDGLGSVSNTHAYTSPGTYTIVLTVTNPIYGTSNRQFTTVTVNNSQPPSIGAINFNNNPVVINNATTATASFTDPDGNYGDTATWQWGDGITSDGTVTESNGSGSVSNNHTYTKIGSYTVILTVTGASGQSSTLQAVIAVSPSGGFQGANLKGANYSEADLSGQTINGNVQDVNFSSANLTNANLQGANAKGSNMSNANLTNANLSKGDFQSINFTDANLMGANLNGSNLKGSTVTGVTWNNTTCPNGTNSDNDSNTCVGQGGGL